MSSVEARSGPEVGLIRALSTRFEIDSANESRLEAACRPEDLPDNWPRQRPTAVGLSSVSTLVCRGKGEILGVGYVVPTFAVHWGIIVRNILFHLRYNSKTKEVQFDFRPWRPRDSDSKYDVHAVGETSHSTDELIEIGGRFPQNLGNKAGNKLIEAFGDYHSLFWNCQTFAKIFLKVICRPPVEAGSWTSADTTYLVCHRNEPNLIG